MQIVFRPSGIRGVHVFDCNSALYKNKAHSVTACNCKQSQLNIIHQLPKDSYSATDKWETTSAKPDC